jgi:hypothetical protein
MNSTGSTGQAAEASERRACLGLLRSDLTDLSVVIARLVEFGANAIVIQELPCIISPTLEPKLAFDGCSILELASERESARHSEAVFFSVLDH